MADDVRSLEDSRPFVVRHSRPMSFSGHAARHTFQGGIAGSNPVGHTTSDQPDTGAVTEEILQRRDDRVLTRVGPAVRHPRHPWSSATRALLEHLSEVAFMPSPRLVGTDGDADLLSYIPGASGADGWAPAVTEEGLAAAAL